MTWILFPSKSGLDITWHRLFTNVAQNQGFNVFLHIKNILLGLGKEWCLGRACRRHDTYFV